MTLNEVNILKNAVLDATEAYVDARLAVADFAKTQIGVTEGEPTKVNKKFYHTVRCNAISGVANSGVVYRNVLSVGNTEFPSGSVVFLIAPNAQFSNQFILGKLDNTPINIVGGSIKIGGDDPDTNPVFSVDKNGIVRIKRGEITLGGTEADPVFKVTDTGIVTIKNGGIYLNKTGNYYHLNLDSTGIKLGHVSNDSYNFTVDASNGSVTIRNGQINLGAVTVGGNNGYDVNINRNGFNLGYLGKVNNVDTYNFSVTDKGVVTMKRGSITLSDKFKVDDSGWLAIGGVDSNANFYVTNAGKVTIKSGSFTLGTNLKIDENGNLYIFGITKDTAKFHVDNTGNMYVGGARTSGTNAANFYVTNAGKVTIKSGEINLNYNTSYNKYGFIVDSNGIKLGAASSGYNFTVDNNGTVAIKQGEITLGGTSSSPNFKVTNGGSIYIKSGEITIGTTTEGSSTVPVFKVASDGTITIKQGSLHIGYRTTTTGTGGDSRYDVNIASNGIRLGYLNDSGSGTSTDPRVAQYNFVVNKNGTVTIKQGSINLGYNSSSQTYKFSVTNGGVLTSTSGYIGGFEITQDRLGNPLNTRYSVGMQGGLNSSAHIYAWDSNYSVKIYPDKIKMDNAQINLEYGSSWCNVTVNNIQSNDKGYVVWHSELSDERYKNNIKEISSKKIKEFFNEIKPSSFKFNKNTEDKDNLIHYGVTAQNLEKALQQSKINSKSLVKFCKEKDMYFVDYQELHGFELAGIKDLYNIIENQQKQIDILKAQIKEVQNG